MNKPNVQLTYHANYNGWDMSINGDYDDPAAALCTDKMVDVTLESTDDDDGEYFYNCLQGVHSIAVRNIVEEALGECHIDIEFDNFSS